MPMHLYWSLSKEVYVVLDIILRLLFCGVSQVQLSHFSCVIDIIVGTLGARLFPQWYATSFETLHVFWSWSKDVHVILYNSQIISY